MKPREIKPGVHAVGAIDWDRRLFDALILLPDGTSYNSYLVRGSSKVALIDAVDPSKEELLMRNLEWLGVKRLDYVIANHAEQDHSGGISRVVKRYPEVQVVCTPKCKGLLIDLLQIPEDRFLTVEDRVAISLGDRSFEFIHAPWVHWPETMLTYLKEDRILFSCDMFGSHLSTTDLFVANKGQLEEAAKRYYAEIMMPFRATMQKNLDRVRDYKIEIIAPSHGPVHNDPQFIIDLYRCWAFDDPKNIVVLPYISMHDSTRKMVEYLVDALSGKGVMVKQFDMSVADLGKLAMSLVDAATVILGSPTVLAGPHPGVAYAAFLANALRPNIKFATIIGSYGWGGKTVEILSGMLPNVKVELLPPVLCKGLPKEADYAALENLAATIALKHEEYNFK